MLEPKRTRRKLVGLLRRSGWNMSAAGRELGISRQRVFQLCERLGVYRLKDSRLGIREGGLADRARSLERWVCKLLNQSDILRLLNASPGMAAALDYLPLAPSNIHTPFHKRVKWQVIRRLRNKGYSAKGIERELRSLYGPTNDLTLRGIHFRLSELHLGGRHVLRQWEAHKVNRQVERAIKAASRQSAEADGKGLKVSILDARVPVVRFKVR